MVKKFFVISVALIVGFSLLVFWAGLKNLGVNDFYEYEYEYDFEKKIRDDEIIVVTYNVGYFSGFENEGLRRDYEIDESEIPKIERIDFLKRSVNILSVMDVDILFVQEIDVESQRSLYVHQVEKISKSLNFPKAHFLVNWNKNFVPHPLTKPNRWFGKVISGQAIFSKYDLESVENVLLEKPKQNFLTNLFYFERYIQVAKADIGGKEIYVINTHLDAFNSEINVRQAEKVLQTYKKYNALGPTLLLGDFNDDVANETLNLFLNFEGLEIVDIFEPTYPSFKPTKRIDHIFYDPHSFQLIETRVLRELNISSDHLPVVAKFKLLK